MPLKVFHPRRRTLFLKILSGAFFLCLIIFWFKVEDLYMNKDKWRGEVNQIDDRANDPTFSNFQDLKETGGEDDSQNAKPKVYMPTNDEMIERMDAEKRFRKIERKIIPGLGEDGKAVLFTGTEKRKAEEIIKKEAFNLLASDKIAYNRSIPDSRDPLCRKVKYDDDLPSASVIIIFTNEAWSALIRTIWSVLNRSPRKFLQEIVLVDDFSDREELGEKLELYVKYKLPSLVKLKRLDERHGLIRARLEGAKFSTGDVIIFLDSHCEANTMWMEPLLHRVKENRRSVVIPIIDVISDDTLEYYHSNGKYFQVGGFTWSGHFTWIEVSPEEETRRGNPVGPTRSPTMAGGLFGMERNYFWEVGGYDEGMDVWGGENLEMSFRVWMCGGVLEVIPCSRVGHIFRSFHPYTFPGNKDTHGLNTARLAEVWMDDYKRLFYLYRNELEKADWGDVSERKLLREKLQCNSFKWYLDNIIPHKFILDEDSIAYGRLKNKGEGNEALCFDTLQRNEKSPYNIGLYGCHSFESSSQFMSLSKNGELRRESACAEVPTFFGSSVEPVRMTHCHGHKGNQEWRITKHGSVVHVSTGKCLDRKGLHSMDDAVVAPCNNSPTQEWHFDHLTHS